MSAPKSKVGTLAYMAPEIIKATGECERVFDRAYC
jgi:serine/threonine protein kinase